MTRFQMTHPAYNSLSEFLSDFWKDDAPKGGHSFFPPANIYETKDEFQVELLVPGRKKEDFKISLDNQLLTIAFEAPGKKEDDARKQVKKEFSLRSFSRSFNLDEKIDAEGIQAKYEDGVLALTLPVREEVKASPKEITVQ